MDGAELLLTQYAAEVIKLKIANFARQAIMSYVQP
jgi:hypothetical protein